MSDIKQIRLPNICQENKWKFLNLGWRIKHQTVKQEHCEATKDEFPEILTYTTKQSMSNSCNTLSMNKQNVENDENETRKRLHLVFATRKPIGSKHAIIIMRLASVTVLQIIIWSVIG